MNLSCRLATVVVLVAVAFSGVATFAADPPYPESTQGLQKLMEDALAATKAGDKEKVAALVKPLVLPDHAAWFKKTFGDEKGAALAEDYDKMAPRLADELTKLLDARVKDGRTFASAVKIESADDQNATGLQKQAIAAMKEKAALYTVRLGDKPGGSGFTLWSFVFVDGQFRLAGKMRPRG